MTQEWVDGYRQANPCAGGFTCCINDLTAGRGNTLEKRIDYIFLVSEDPTRTHVRAAELVFAQPFEQQTSPSGLRTIPACKSKFNLRLKRTSHDCRQL